jgi:hypothetical protein
MGGAGGGGGMNPCTELGPTEGLVTNFDDWDTTTLDPEDWVVDWAANDTSIALQDGFPQREFEFITESAADYALRVYAGPTEQNGGTVEFVLTGADACIDASVFDGIQLTLRGAISTTPGQFEIGFMVDAPGGQQPDTLLFDLGTDIDDVVVLQIPFSDFDQDLDPNIITGISIGIDKGAGGSYELIIDEIVFY